MTLLSRCPKCGGKSNSPLVRRGAMWLCSRCADKGDKKLMGDIRDIRRGNG